MSPFPDDPYCYPGTDILRNLAEIRDPEELRIFEADAVAVNIIELRRNQVKGPFDARRLKETHRRIFGNVYPWAGEFRQGIGMMTKERSGFVVTYEPSENVPAALAATFAALNAENELRAMDSARFAGRLAYYYSELDASMRSAKETRAPSATFRPTLPGRQATGSIGPKRRGLQILNSAFTTLAIWQSCANTPPNLHGSSHHASPLAEGVPSSPEGPFGQTVHPMCLRSPAIRCKTELR